MMSSRPGISWPISKKVPSTCFSRRTSRKAGVYSLGPSSKVRATTLRSRGPLVSRTGAAAGAADGAHGPQPEAALAAGRQRLRAGWARPTESTRGRPQSPRLSSARQK